MLFFQALQIKLPQQLYSRFLSLPNLVLLLRETANQRTAKMMSFKVTNQMTEILKSLANQILNLDFKFHTLLCLNLLIKKCIDCTLH